MPRLFIEGPLSASSDLELPPDAVRHVQVLRLQTGDALVLFDGRGDEFPARILDMGRRTVRVAVGEACPVNRESPLQITLVQALSAAERMDYTVQKATETGISAIQVVYSSYCSYRLPEDRVEKRLAHWRAIAVSAAEQSGRTRIPELRSPRKLADWLAEAPPADLKLLLSPIEGIRHQALPAQAQSVLALVGPEGGLSEDEEEAARQAGFTALRLGPRIFRTETVAPVIATLLQLRYGDF